MTESQRILATLSDVEAYAYVVLGGALLDLPREQRERVHGMLWAATDERGRLRDRKVGARKSDGRAAA